MKSMFSQMINSSLFNHAKRLAIVFVFLSYAAVATAGGGGEEYWTKAQVGIHPNSPTGSGMVYVYESSNSSNKSKEATEPGGDCVSLTQNYTTSTYTAVATANEGYYFEKWVQNDQSTPVENYTESTGWNSTTTYYATDANYKFQLKASDQNNSLGNAYTGSTPYYAIFKHRISTSNIGNIAVWEGLNGIESAAGNVTAEIYNSDQNTQLNVELVNDDNDLNSLSKDNFSISKSVISPEDAKYSFTVSYIGAETNIDNLRGKCATIQLSLSGKGAINIKVYIKDPPVLIFKGTDGKGTYSSNRFSSETFNGSSNEPYTYVAKSSDELQNVSLELTSDKTTDGMIFWGWKRTSELGVSEVFSNEISCTKTFNDGDIIEPFFVPNTCGYMVMRDDGSEKRYTGDGIVGAILGSYDYWAFNLTALSMHHDLQDALNAASYQQIVVFENLATIFSKFLITRPEGFEQPSIKTEAVLPYRDGGYTIPENVVLLIPGDAIYSYSSNFRGLDQHRYQAHAALSTYRKLVVEQGTEIKVRGDLCVSSVLTTGASGGIRLGGSTASGILELQNNVHIDVQNGGNVFAYGYIINPQGTTITDGDISSVGRLTARNGATIHESFQVEDWRGGTAALGMIDNEKKVFPINQYYIQNIEAPITFEYGSSENVATAATISSAKTLISTNIIVPKTATDQKDGLLVIGEGCSLNKYYDYINDRMIFHLKGTGLGSYSTIGNVSLPVSRQTIDSKAYVLGINNNIDIRITNITVDLPYSVNLFAGTKFQIDHDAKLIADANDDNTIASIYLYDLEWSTRDGKGTSASTKPDGYFGMDEKTIALLSYRPGGFKSPRRTLKNDASMLVNGVLEIGKKGALYTTTLGTEGFSYGANIYSTGAGRIKFNNIGSDDVVHQAYQDGDENTTLNYFDIPVASAKLKNSNGEYTETSTSDEGKVYMYIDGTWQLPPWQLPTLLVTMPEQTVKGLVAMTIPEEYKSGSFTATINGDGFSFDEANTQKSKSINYDSKMGANIEVDVYYTSLNQNGSHTATITLTHSTGGTYSNTLSATENYIPKFSVSPTELNLGETYINRPIEEGTPTFQISPQSEDNVTSLHDDDTYYSKLKWEAVSIKNLDNSDNTNFTFTPGEGKNALSGAKITFNSATPGTQSVKITLRATYTDASSQQIPSEDVIINVTATAKALKTNNFALTENCQNELKNMCVGIPVTLEFQGLTANTKPLDFDFANNGAVGSEVLTLSVEGTVYTITATSVPANPANMPTITISQDPDGTYEGHTTEAYTTSIANCSPSVQWNWSDLYFGEEFTEPVVSNSDGLVTLTLTKLETKDGTEITDDAEIQKIISYNSTEKKATIGTDLEGEYIATFSFVQAKGTSHMDYSETFTSAIYARPNVLNVCVESERIFKGLQVGNTAAYFAEEDQVVFPSGTSWIINFVGVPDILSFTPTINTQLTVLESANGSSWASAYYAPVNADTPYEVELEPTTRYLQFSVVQGTALQDLCIKKLDRVKADAEILYMPIAADPENDPTKRDITFTYVSDKDLDIRFSTDDFSSETETLTKTGVGEYGKVTITVASKATTEQEARLTIQEQVSAGNTANIKLEVPIETYRFPQKLPIQLETGKDEAKRFYYVATFYKDVEWDAANYAINLKKKTSAEDDNPYVTFAFDGAPKFISFVPQVDNTQSNWKIEESPDGTVWGECQDPTMENGVLKQTLLYTTRYVHVTYVGKNMDVVKMTKVNILSDQSAVPNPEGLNLTEKNTYTNDLTVGEDLVITTINLTNMTISTDNENFTLSYDKENPNPATTFTLDASKIDNVFGADVVGEIPFEVFWNAAKVSEFGTITITTTIDDEVKTLATVPLVGNATSIQQDAELYTGVKNDYKLIGSFMGIYAIEGNDGTEHRPVDLSNTYDASGNALFDFLVIYGETTTTDGSIIITEPTNTVGSNAKTPVSIYYREDGVYKFAMMEENANAANKMMPYLGVEKDQTMRVYITGFCPYASTGYTKEDEGVWYFQGVNGAKLEIYLDDCYIYSRNKTPEGRSFSGRYDGQAFSENYVRGSGGVLVFENQDNDKNGSFDVTIHTRRNNMFKSNYGCFFELMKGMRAYQVSSPIQVHLAGEEHLANSVTNITFDDKWPTDATYDAFVRTNGYLSLQKQHNNAPSIDLGNSNTTVEFAGGKVELQNAAVVSLNYKTTLAISYRSGLMAGFPMAYGIGTDAVGGKVRFTDGTTTVIPMKVDVKFRDYYLMDTQILKDKQGNDSIAELSTTSCLRCPTNTVVTGGSHCMMRACEDVTSKGGAPLDENGTPLGIYKYPKTKPDANGAGVAPRGGWTDKNDGTGLVTPNDVPAGYNVESVTPNTNGTVDTNDDYLNFWFTTDEESTVKPEVDKTISFWKACMTEIAAEYMSYGGTVGGDTKIFPNEEIKYLLYCQLDENINNVITAGNGTGDDKVFTYKAPVKDPTGQLSTPYLTVIPTYVGDEWQNYIETVERNTDSDDGGTINTGDDYSVTDKIYYVVPATADVWMTFTAPFNVEKLWIVETYDEAALAATPEKEVTDEEDNTTKLNKRQSVLLEQAKHNADFAAFFGVAMALGRDQTFDEIYRDYIGWAMQKDAHEGSQTDYAKRGKIQLQHYNGSNFATAHYYLYKNAGEWTWNNDKYDTQWQVVGEVNEGEILMHQGETYSLLFPYCTGCDVEKNDDGTIKKDGNGLPIMSYTRDYWDYWSGKFLIFESTQATADNPHTIKGSAYHDALFAPAKSGDGNSALLTGNSTFALMTSNKAVDDKVYTYAGSLNLEGFENSTTTEDGITNYQKIQPTVSFLIADIASQSGMPARRITRSGQIIYGNSDDNNGTTTGGNMPTVGGDNDLFVTSIAGGINIAVAAPQYVRVLSSTGALLFSGMVQTSVDVTLPANGVYVIAGENEVQKILY